MKNGKLRKVLVVFQFAVSILLIIGTLIMYRQINYMLNKDLGFNKENLVVINRAGVLGTRIVSFKEAVKNIPGVINISSATSIPGRVNNKNGYGIEGRMDESFILTTTWADYDFLKTYEMTLDTGRYFDKEYSSDQQACILNEAAVKNFGITDIQHTRIMLPTGTGDMVYLPIIGVVNNYNFESLRNPVQPCIILYQTDNYLFGYITVRISAQNYSATISDIEKIWKEYTSNVPMQYYFLDQDLEQMYIQEKQNAQMAIIFSILAIFIATLGLFGLTSFTVEQRTREIGVRKAMGSSVAGIYMVISREIVILVFISAIIAWPLIYYVAGKWLENFYYRISLGIFVFIAGFIVAMGVALLTISFRVVKAARINPAQSLKYE